ncbi:hypothetical protein GCM10010385_68290 [Streptomyces geysiriensis]|nr:hypothetical protein GCM10010385_68290 [Streptomyces geysiriensis]GHC43571.1 hypothetical protein GCM10010308_73480 [Streptomyces vinaceusdrappus]
MGRVVLDTSFSSHDAEELWASLTTQEARGLAGLPLYQAAAVDPRAPEAPGVVEVLPVAGEAYAIRIRGHELTVDQPLTDGGKDTAPTPVGSSRRWPRAQPPTTPDASSTGTVPAVPASGSALSSEWWPTGRPGWLPCP